MLDVDRRMMTPDGVATDGTQGCDVRRCDEGSGCAWRRWTANRKRNATQRAYPGGASMSSLILLSHRLPCRGRRVLFEHYVVKHGIRQSHALKLDVPTQRGQFRVLQHPSGHPLLTPK